MIKFQLNEQQKRDLTFAMANDLYGGMKVLDKDGKELPELTAFINQHEILARGHELALKQIELVVCYGYGNAYVDALPLDQMEALWQKEHDAFVKRTGIIQ